MHKYLLKHISSGKDLDTNRFLIHDVVLFCFTVLIQWIVNVMLFLIFYTKSTLNYMFVFGFLKFKKWEKMNWGC